MQLSISKFEVACGIADDDFSSFSQNGYLILRNPLDRTLIDELALWAR